MVSLKVVSLCLLLIALPLTLASRCKSCGDRCTKCEYGYTYSNTCEFNVCYKGPGETCGYVDIDDRLCAEGLYCKNEKCQGCALSPFKCFVESLPTVKKSHSNKLLK